MNTAGTLDPIRGGFRAVMAACVPEAGHLTSDEWRRAETIVNEALASRPSSVRRQLVLFVHALGVLAWVRYRRPLQRLAPDRVQALLRSLERAPLLLLRRGTWGLRTLAFMGYYGQDGVQRALGYRAVAEGWGAAASAGGPWPERGGAAPPESWVLTVGDGVPDKDGSGRTEDSLG